MLLGVLIVIIGCLLLMNVLYPSLAIGFDLLLPIALIVFSLTEMIKNRYFNVPMVLLFYIGLFFFIKNLGIVSVDISGLFWPLLLIILGMCLILEKGFNQNTTITSPNSTGILEYRGLFGEVKDKIESSFKGAKITSVFGAVDLDLSKAKISDDVTINVDSYFGGSNLIVPADAKVVIRSNSLFAGDENRHVNPEHSKYTIYVNCHSYFGGVDIK